MRVHNQAIIDDNETNNPFGEDEGYSDGTAGSGWDVTSAMKTTFDNKFHSAKLTNGRLQGTVKPTPNDPQRTHQRAQTATAAGHGA